MRFLLRLLSAMSRVERIFLGTLCVILVASFFLLVHQFFVENTTSVAATGGTYIEGAVGELQPMNPWFVTGNDVTRDVLSLVFAGLMKYDPASGSVVNDLATVVISRDYRTFTATLKPDVRWHDGTPVTADDVMFTFTTPQQPDFPNPILRQNFRGVTIEKIDGRTVKFTLQKPYVFFTSNLTLGLVPKKAFDGVPTRKLNQTLDFGFSPIGAGPYSFVNLMQSELSTEVTLKRFPRAGFPQTHIERIVFHIFPDYSTLLTDILNLNGVRQVPRNASGLPILPARFTPVTYTLPQYVAAFFNLDRPIVADKNVRLGLQLATNKQEIVDAIFETKVIDTPLLEVDLGDWQYKFDAEAAKGAFFASSWNMPEKLRLQRLLEERNTNAVGPLHNVPRLALLGTGAMLTLTGSTLGVTFPVAVNGIRVQTGITLPDGSLRHLSGSWIVKIPAGDGGSGSLKIGVNIVKMTNAKLDIIDSAYVERFSVPQRMSQAAEEQRLVDVFLQSKTLLQNDPRAITVLDLYLDQGYLRRKTPSDQPHTRVNDRGRLLSLTLLTSSKPDSFATVATLLRKQWESVGVHVAVDIPPTKSEFEDRLLKRDYDVVLFGESLLDNLDSYPYWHSSQIQERGDVSKMRLDAFNLSQFASFEADELLTRIRETADPSLRKNALEELNGLFKRELPALPLYSPLSIYAHDASIHGVTLKKLSVHGDRFAHIEDWYVTEGRQFLPDRGWFSFPGWMWRLFKGKA